MNQKITLGQVRREAAKHGATVDDTTLPSFFNVDLPVKCNWKATGGHSLHVNRVDAVGDLDSEVIQDSYRDVLERMAMGTVECDDPDCDFCLESPE